MKPVNSQASPETMLVSFENLPATSILESSLRSASYNRFSIFAFDPVEVFEFESDQTKCPFSALAERVAAYPAISNKPGILPFVGGWIGYFSYEAGFSGEKISHSTQWDIPLPQARFCLYDATAQYDHVEDCWYLSAVDWPEPFARNRPTVAQRLESLKKQLKLAEQNQLVANPQPVATHPAVNMTYEDYLSKVDRAKQYIEAGDIYQVNLTQRFSVETNESPLSIYRRLRKVNPASHAAFIHCGDTSILSASPELFLHLQDGQVITRPIKGTAPRTGDLQKDALARTTLQTSEKDRAELTMIIDLLRNDLGRVCDYSSIDVIEANEIEEHPTVFHQAATIQGKLAAHRNWIDLLKATFPGGSITGAPKIRAMQIINELEKTARGVYCGSIGWIGLDGSMSMNIAIRTMVHHAQHVHFYAGGAIVADSIPTNEYDEIIAKASGMMRALNCEAPIRVSDLVEAISI